MDAQIIQFRAKQEDARTPRILDRLEDFGAIHDYDMAEAIVYGLGANADQTYDRLACVKAYSARLGSYEAAAMDILRVVVDCEPAVEVAWINTLAAIEAEIREDFEGLLNQGYVPRDLPPNVIELPFPPVSSGTELESAS